MGGMGGARISAGLGVLAPPRLPGLHCCPASLARARKAEAEGFPGDCGPRVPRRGKDGGRKQNQA